MIPLNASNVTFESLYDITYDITFRSPAKIDYDNRYSLEVKRNLCIIDESADPGPGLPSAKQNRWAGRFPHRAPWLRL